MSLKVVQFSHHVLDDVFVHYDEHKFDDCDVGCIQRMAFQFSMIAGMKSLFDSEVDAKFELVVSDKATQTIGSFKLLGYHREEHQIDVALVDLEKVEPL